MNTQRKVLVVDDDPVVGKSFDRVLSRKGYAVITARSGDEALSKLQSESYDVVFTDIRMPGMSGLEVAEKVRASQPWTPVVIITGYGNEESERRAKAAGVCELLHKPLSPEMIVGSAAHAIATAPAAAEVSAPVTPAAEPRESALKNIALFFAAPFIGLAYLIALPFVGMAVMGMLAVKAAGQYPLARRIGTVLKHIGMVIAAPVVGLAFVVVFPFAGLAALVWLGGQRLLKGES